MFRKQKTSKKLSAEELKMKLYDRFDKSGSLNQLRSQIRSQLVSELFKMAPPSATVSNQNKKAVDLDNTLLPLQVCNWLVYDHLLRQGYQYSLSTFVSETNLPNVEKLLTAGDILGLFGLDNSSPELNKIVDFYSNSGEKGNLHSLLLAIIKSLIYVPEKDKQQIRTLEDPQQQTVKNDISSSSEMFAQKASSNFVNEVSNNKTCNVTGLKETKSLESSFHEQLELVKEEKKQEIQTLRHKLLQELERLHSQEHSLLQEIEQERKELRKERDLIFSEREKLKEKENMCIKEHENKLQKKIREIEEINVAKLHSKEKELNMLQEELREKERKLGQSDYELSSHRERFDSLKSEVDDINQMYKTVHKKYNTLLDENTDLVRKFESMSDYNVLKEELAAKSKEISALKQEIENLHRIAERNKRTYTETVSSLELKLKATEPKLHQVQKELNQTRETLHFGESLWENEKERLERESLTSKELYKTFLQRIEEQKQDIHDLHQTIHVLHYQLTSETANRATNLHSFDSLRTSPKVLFSQSKNNYFMKPNTNNPITLSQKYREKALNFTSEYKSRLDKLQQEVEAGIDKYSLISHSSLDSKMPNVKPYLSRSPLNFTQSTKVGNSYFTSSNFDPGNGFKKLRTTADSKYDKFKVPSFLNRNNYNQSSESDKSTMRTYENSKSFGIGGKNAPTSIATTAQKSIAEQQLEPSEIFKPNSTFQNSLEKYQTSENFQITPFPSSITSQAELHTDNFSMRGSEAVLTEMTSELLLNTSVTKTKLNESENYKDLLAAKQTPFSESVFTSAYRNNEHLYAKSNVKDIDVLQQSGSIAQNQSAIPTNPLEQLNANLNTETLHASSNPLKQSGMFYSPESSSILPTKSFMFHVPTSTESAPSMPLPPLRKPLEHSASGSTPIVSHDAYKQPMESSATGGSSSVSRDAYKQHIEPSDGGSTSIGTHDTYKQPIEPSASGSTSIVSHDAYKQSEAAPVVVDLDAAWKRKASVPTLQPSFFKETRQLIFPTVSTANYKNPESKLDIKLDSPNLKSQDGGSFNDNQSNVTNTELISTVEYQGDSNTMSASNILTPSSKDVEPCNSNATNKQLTDFPIEVGECVSKSGSEKQSKEKSLNKVVVSSDTDEEVKVKRKLPNMSLKLNETKTEDSLSELSEVHMSYGSEQEEQKEESDNW